MKKITIDLVEKIRDCKELVPFSCSICTENGVEVRVDASIGSWYCVRPDVYYNSKKIGDRPPAVDCLFTIACKKHSHDHYLIELKGTRTSLTEEWHQIYRKFEETINRFMFSDFDPEYSLFIKRFFVLVVVHQIDSYDLQLVTKKLFNESVKIQNLTLYIRLEQSPYTIKKC